MRLGRVAGVLGRVLFFFQAEDGIRDIGVTGVQTCALPIFFLSKFKQGLGSWGIEDVVKKYLKLAGIEDASVHALRHTMATQHVRKGTDLRVKIGRASCRERV